MLSTPRNDPSTLSAVTQPTPPQPGYYPLQMPPPPKRGMSTGAILGIVLGGVAVAFLLVCAGLAAFAPDPKPTAQPAAQPPAATEAATQATTTAQATPTSAAGPLTSFGDGTHEVGTGPGQIPPGTYVATVPEQVFDFCMWSRLKGFSGEGRDTITFGTGNKGDKQRVTIAPTDKGFETKGCGTWTKA
jgi:hypothetical protein